MYNCLFFFPKQFECILQFSGWLNGQTLFSTQRLSAINEETIEDVQKVLLSALLCASYFLCDCATEHSPILIMHLHICTINKTFSLDSLLYLFCLFLFTHFCGNTKATGYSIVVKHNLCSKFRDLCKSLS